MNPKLPLQNKLSNKYRPFRIHFILIARSSGVPIYYQALDTSSAAIDVTLLSGFISAILSLSTLLKPQASTSNESSTTIIGDFGLNYQRYYIYQREDYLVSILISNESESSMKTPKINEIGYHLVEDIWKTFNELISSKKRKRSGKEPSGSIVLGQKDVSTIRSKINNILYKFSLNTGYDNFFPLIEEVIEQFYLDERDATETINSLVQIFQHMLQDG